VPLVTGDAEPKLSSPTVGEQAGRLRARANGVSWKGAHDWAHRPVELLAPAMCLGKFTKGPLPRECHG
jgi:hypothetical protein